MRTYNTNKRKKIKIKILKYFSKKKTHYKIILVSHLVRKYFHSWKVLYCIRQLSLNTELRPYLYEPLVLSKLRSTPRFLARTVNLIKRVQIACPKISAYARKL